MLRRRTRAQQRFDQGGDPMATYLGLFKFTQKGAESLKESPGRIDAARQLAKITWRGPQGGLPGDGAVRPRCLH